MLACESGVADAKAATTSAGVGCWVVDFRPSTTPWWTGTVSWLPAALQNPGVVGGATATTEEGTWRPTQTGAAWLRTDVTSRITAMTATTTNANSGPLRSVPNGCVPPQDR